jgi:glycosyltransferase involved in cell wall biosynthesis
MRTRAVIEVRTVPTRRRVLYFVHSDILGGALLSLRYMLMHLDRTRYEPVVACLSPLPHILAEFESIGVMAFHAPGIEIFPHTTGGWNSLIHPLGLLGFTRAATRFIPSIRAVERVVRNVEPDIVHVNSLVMAACAAGARRVGVPVVWHIRESVHPGHIGIRRWWLESRVRRWADTAIFISEDDRRRLVHEHTGLVLPNSVDHKLFDRSLDGGVVRAELGIPTDAAVVLFLGGYSRLKGAHVLLRALQLSRRAVPHLHAIMAAADVTASNAVIARAARRILPLVGMHTQRQEYRSLIEQGDMASYLHEMPFRRDPERLVAAADVVVFPSTAPHFARPVIEAGAMGKPVVASRIGGVEELVDDGTTGLLVEPCDPIALSSALTAVLVDRAYAKRLGDGGYARSLRLHSTGQYMAAIGGIYECVFARQMANDNSLKCQDTGAPEQRL